MRMMIAIGFGDDSYRQAVRRITVGHDFSVFVIRYGGIFKPCNQKNFVPVLRKLGQFINRTEIVRLERVFVQKILV